MTELQQDGFKQIFDECKVAERREMGQLAVQVGSNAAVDLAAKQDWEEAARKKSSCMALWARQWPRWAAATHYKA